MTARASAARLRRLGNPTVAEATDPANCSARSAECGCDENDMSPSFTRFPRCAAARAPARPFERLLTQDAQWHGRPDRNLEVQERPGGRGDEYPPPAEL